MSFWNNQNEILLCLHLGSYGGPAPRLSGSLALDLHRMNKIIEVNQEYSYAVVEPGVTFTDLYDYCVFHKLKVWPSVPSLGWGSVVGNVNIGPDRLQILPSKH